MAKFKTAGYYARPKINPDDIDLGRPVLEHVERAVAIAVESLMVDPFYPPRAMFACSYVGDDSGEEPPSVLLATFPMVNPDEPAELRIDLEAVVNEVIWMHRDDDGGGFDAEAREAIEAIADMLQAQATKLRSALAEGPICG